MKIVYFTIKHTQCIKISKLSVDILTLYTDNKRYISLISGVSGAFQQILINFIPITSIMKECMISNNDND